MPSSRPTYYLTLRCFRAQEFLRAEHACKWFTVYLAAARQKHGFDLWAYAIMPDHAHLLVRPLAQTPISRVISAVKQPVARRAIGGIRRFNPQFLSSMADTKDGRVVYRLWDAARV